MTLAARLAIPASRPCAVGPSRGPRPRARRPGPGHGHQRRRAGARLQPRHAHGPGALRRVGRRRCRRAAAVRKLERAGIDVTVIDEPDDAIATGILAAHLTDVRADVVHNHMYRAEIVGTKAAIALGEAGHRRPWVIVDRPLVARPLRRGPGVAAAPHAGDRPPDRRLALDRPQGRRRGPRRRPAVAHLQRRRPRPLRPPGAVLHAARGVRHGAVLARSSASSGRLELEKGHPTLLEAWPLVLRRVPEAYLLDRGEGSRLDALHDIARDHADRCTGSCSPGAATTSRR